jgi:hypothetical protein
MQRIQNNSLNHLWGLQTVLLPSTPSTSFGLQKFIEKSIKKPPNLDL